jgi:hypothetical protein
MKFIKEEVEFNKKAVKLFCIIFAYVNIILLIAYFSTAVWDTQWNKMNSTGQIVYNTYTFLYWMFFVYFVLNILLVMLLFGFLADTKNKPIIDLHFILSMIISAFNLVFIVLLLVYYLFIINTNFSASLPFNDPFYCCGYWMTNPDQCYNTGPCVWAPSTLRANYEFTLHWIFSGVFFVVSLLHMGINRILRTSKIVSIRLASPESWIKTGAFVSYIYVGLFVYWTAGPLWDTIFINGFPLLGIPPGPGPYYTNLYTYQWWFIFFLVGNILPPILYFASILNNKSTMVSWLFFWVTILICITTFVSLGVLFGVWIFQCNNSIWLNSEGSICNSYQYCCRHFASATNTCPNTTPCPYPTDLQANGEYVQHMIFALIFDIMTAIMIWLWYRLSYNKVISK